MRKSSWTTTSATRRKISRYGIQVTVSRDSDGDIATIASRKILLIIVLVVSSGVGVKFAQFSRQWEARAGT
jgi:hypothetical protein